MEGLVSPLGLTPEMVAAEARRKLFELIEVPESEFTAEKKEHWREGAAMLFVVTQQIIDGKELPADRTTNNFKNQVDKDSSTNIPPLVWEAVVRFSLNLISAGAEPEPGDTRAELQAELAQARDYNWKTWIAQKVEKQGVKS